MTNELKNSVRNNLRSLLRLPSEVDCKTIDEFIDGIIELVKTEILQSLSCTRKDREQ